MDNVLSFPHKFFRRLLLNKDIPSDTNGQPNNYRRLSRKEVLKLIENNGGSAGLDLSYCEFSDVDLSNINFSGDWEGITHGANFEGSRFRHCNFQNCNLDLINFQNAIVMYSNLSNTSIRGANCSNANFRESDFRYANLYRSQLTGADFYQADLELTDLYRASNLKDALLDKSNFGDQILQEKKSKFEEYLTIHNLGDNEQVITQRYRRASEVYLHIKNAFTQQGKYKDARWAYLKERRIYRSAINPFLVRKNFPDELDQQIKIWNWQWWWFYIKFTTRWILSWMEDFSCGYGELPSKTIVLSLIIIFLFPVVYQQTGGITGASNELDYFNYSLGAFTTIGFNNFQATTPISQVLTSLEAITGISMLALLMYTLGNRISRS